MPVDNFEQLHDGLTTLDNPDDKEQAVNDMMVKKQAFDKIFLDVFNTPAGKRMFELLSERYVAIKIAKVGENIDQIMYRQGGCDLVTQMYKCVEDALSPDVSADEVGQG